MTTNTQRRASSDRGIDLRSTFGQVTKEPKKYGSWAAAVLFTVLVVAGLVALFQAQGGRTEVLVVANDVAPGQVIAKGDVVSAEVAGVPDAVPASEKSAVVGQRATAGLVEGQVLTESALNSDPVPGKGERLVALQLGMGRVPGGLAGGDLVDVLVVAADGASATKEQLQAREVLAAAAKVERVGKAPDGSSVVTVLVEADVSDQLAAYAAAGQLTIVQAPVGE